MSTGGVHRPLLLLGSSGNPRVSPTSRSALGWSAGHGWPVVAGIKLKHETSVWFEITNPVIAR